MKTLNEKYLHALSEYEESERSFAPSAQVDHLQKTVSTFAEINSRLALYGASLTSLLETLLLRAKELSQDKNKQPEFNAMDRELGDLMLLGDRLLMMKNDEGAYCKTMERMQLDILLRKSGIDPTDKEAVKAFILSSAQSFVLPPGQN